MVQFLSVLIETVQTGKIDLVFFFNGSLESERMGEWIATQLKARQNINFVSNGFYISIIGACCLFYCISLTSFFFLLLYLGLKTY